MAMMLMLTVPQVSYAAPCVLGDVCAIGNAVCHNGRCQCRDGFGLNDTGTTIACGLSFCPAILLSSYFYFCRHFQYRLY